VGLELRLSWNGDLRMSQVYREPTALKEHAETKRLELPQRSWFAPRRPLSVEQSARYVHMQIASVMVLEGAMEKVLGEIPDTPGVHGTGPVR
jgi:hypothetical protein